MAQDTCIIIKDHNDRMLIERYQCSVYWRLILANALRILKIRSRTITNKN